MSPFFVGEVCELDVNGEFLVGISQVIDGQLLVELGGRAEGQVEQAQQRRFADVVSSDDHEVAAHTDVQVRQASVVADGYSLYSHGAVSWHEDVAEFAWPSPPRR